MQQEITSARDDLRLGMLFIDKRRAAVYIARSKIYMASQKIHHPPMHPHRLDKTGIRSTGLSPLHKGR